MIQGAIEAFPKALEDQLKDGGRVGALFADGALGVVRIGHKRDGQITWRDAFNANAPILADFLRQDTFTL